MKALLSLSHYHPSQSSSVNRETQIDTDPFLLNRLSNMFEVAIVQSNPVGFCQGSFMSAELGLDILSEIVCSYLHITPMAECRVCGNLDLFF